MKSNMLTNQTKSRDSLKAARILSNTTYYPFIQGWIFFLVGVAAYDVHIK